MLDSEVLQIVSALTARIEQLEARVKELTGQIKRGYSMKEAAELCGYRSTNGLKARLAALGLAPNDAAGVKRVTPEMIEAVQRGRAI